MGGLLRSDEVCDGGGHALRRLLGDLLPIALELDVGDRPADDLLQPVIIDGKEQARGETARLKQTAWKIFARSSVAE